LCGWLGLEGRRAKLARGVVGPLWHGVCCGASRIGWPFRRALRTVEASGERPQSAEAAR
jgi:hypothetical protein